MHRLVLFVFEDVSVAVHVLLRAPVQSSAAAYRCLSPRLSMVRDDTGWANAHVGTGRSVPIVVTAERPALLSTALLGRLRRFST